MSAGYSNDINAILRQSWDCWVLPIFWNMHALKNQTSSSFWWSGKPSTLSRCICVSSYFPFWDFRKAVTNCSVVSSVFCLVIPVVAKFLFKIQRHRYVLHSNFNCASFRMFIIFLTTANSVQRDFTMSCLSSRCANTIFSKSLSCFACNFCINLTSLSRLEKNPNTEHCRISI